MNVNEIKQNTEQLTALFVEDDDELRNSTAKILSNLFAQVDTAPDGERGWECYQEYEKLKGAPYDLVITDINMPKMSGVEMSGKILDYRPSQIIIIVSAHNEAEHLHKAIDLGITGFITKPIEYQRFLRTIDRAAKIILDDQLKKLLIEQERMNSIHHLLHNIAHHWRQPLNIISITVDNLLDLHETNELDSATLEESAKTLKETSRELSQTISSFSQIFSQQSGNETFSPEEVIQQAISIIQPDFTTQNIQLETIIEKASLMGNKKEFVRTLLTFLNNASEAIQKKAKDAPETEGLITIHVSVSHDTLTLQITDNGIGMEQELTARIFEPYYTTKFQSSGVGVSLYYAKQFIEKQLEGSLGVTSSVGEGACFTIKFPRKILDT